MFRVFVCSLAIASAVLAAEDNSQTLNADNVDQKIIQMLKLNAEEQQLAKNGEEASAQQFAYESSLGLNVDKLSCKSFKVDPAQIKFTLFSMPSQNITWNGSENKNLQPYFDPELDTQILISGRLQSEEVFEPAKLAFTHGVRGRKMNVISVNWDNYSSCAYIVSVFSTVPGVANVVADMIKNTLADQSQMNYNKLRLTGFGFGAHIAGLAARKLPQSPARLTVLDPAGFLYNILPNKLKVKKGDAKFMDAIMTNRGLYGLSELVGDVNFLPNGGRVQEGCNSCNCGSSICANECSHTRAIAYYLESAQFGHGGFVAKPAKSWNDFLNQKSFVNTTEIMGEGVSQKNTGSYYLRTNANSPYSQGINGAYLFDKSPNQPGQQSSA